MTEKEEPLLPRVAEGDAEAVQECIKRYKSLIWWLATRHSGGDPEDAVQEIFIDVWKSASRFDPSKAAESTFVGMIARRRLIDRHRKSSRAPDMEPLADDDRMTAHVRPESIEASAEVALAGKSIAELSEAERKVLSLSIYQGMSHSEISDYTSIPLGTVKTHIRRGLARVRKKLEDADRGAAGAEAAP